MEIGKVIEEKGKYAVVKMKRTEACDKCRACSMGAEGKDMFIEGENLCQATVGDLVKISLEQSSFISAVFIMYTVPLIALLIGIGVGYGIGSFFYISWVEYLAIAIGFLFTGVTYLWIRLNESKFEQKKYRPKILEIVKE